MGTIVISGRGVVLIEKIGVHTEIGKIGKSLSKIEDSATPLHQLLKKPILG